MLPSLIFPAVKVNVQRKFVDEKLRKPVVNMHAIWDYVKFTGALFEPNFSARFLKENFVIFCSSSLVKCLKMSF